jgi:hypothetical protein
MNSSVTCRLNAALRDRCFVMAYILQKPSKGGQFKSPNRATPRGALQFKRDNWLSNRVFNNDDNLIAHCCAAWNKLEDQPRRIMSIGLRDWAHRY